MARYSHRKKQLAAIFGGQNKQTEELLDYIALNRESWEYFKEYALKQISISGVLDCELDWRGSGFAGYSDGSNGLTYQEIANQLHITRTNVRQIEFRAIRKLRMRLGL